MDKREFIFLQSSDISMGLMDSNLQRQIEEIKKYGSQSHSCVRTPPIPWFSHYYLHECWPVLALMIHAYALLCFLASHSLLLASAQHS